MSRDNLGRFLKGHNTWNKGKYGYMGANCGSFTKEDIARMFDKTIIWYETEAGIISAIRTPERGTEKSVKSYFSPLNFTQIISII